MYFYDLSSHVTGCHFHHNLLVISLNQILGEDSETPSLHERMNGKVALQKSMRNGVIVMVSVGKYNLLHFLFVLTGGRL